MKRYALTLATLVVLIVPTKAQPYPPYGPGPDPREWGEEEQNRRMPPWPQSSRRPWGSQMVPCIYFDDCRGPRYRDFESTRPYPMPPDPFPPQRGRMWEDD